MYRINEFLTPSERLEAMRFGALKKLASMGYKPSDFNRLVKSAAEGNSSDPISILGAALKTSIYVGVPFGVVWYALTGGAQKDSLKTKKLKATLDHYNDLTAKKISSLEANGLINTKV